MVEAAAGLKDKQGCLSPQSSQSLLRVEETPGHGPDFIEEIEDVTCAVIRHALEIEFHFDYPLLLNHSEVTMNIAPRGSIGGGLPLRKGVGDCCLLTAAADHCC